MNPHGRLVGRDAALGIAGAALADALAGTGTVLLVTGEPGIGKSALLAEVSRDATSRGARVLRGVGWNGAGAPPYWLWTQVLRGIGTGLEPAALGEASRLLAGPRQGEADSAQEAADAQFRLFDAVATALHRLADDAPLVVILDDLHWADNPSLRLLEFVTTQVSASAVLVLGSYRDTEAGEALHRMAAPVLPLAPLGPADIANLMTVVAGSRPSEARADAVWRHCGGNPLFVRELTRLVLARGGWGMTDSNGSLPIPEGVRETLAERLNRLSPPCAEVLAVIACSGLDVQLDVVARVCELPSDAVVDLLDEAMRARVIVSDEPGAARIAHDLFRDAILARIPAARRAHLHAATGRALLALAGGPGVRDLSAVGGAARLAAHFMAAGPAYADEARRYSVAAAQEATTRLGHDDAAVHYENALRLGSTGSADIELLLALAAAQDRAGDAAAARNQYARAAEAARAAADTTALASAALGVHDLGSRAGADVREVTDLLTEAADRLAALAPDRAAAALRSRVLAALARTYRHATAAPVARQAHAAAAEAVELAGTADDPATLAIALLAAHDVAWRPGSAAERLKLATAMADAAGRSDDRDLVAEATLLHAAALIELGDPAGRAELVAYTELADRLGHARGRWQALSRRATLAQMAGRVDEAIDHADAAVELGAAIGIPDAFGCHSTLRGSLGALGAPVPPVDALLADTDPLWPMFPLLRAWTDVYNGEHERAAALMRAFAIRDIADRHDLELLAAAATVCAEVGTAAQQKWLYDQLAPHAGTHVVVGGCAAYHGAVDHLLGRLAAAQRHHDEAAQHFTAAIEMHDRLGTPAWGELSRHARESLAPTDVFQRDGDTWQVTFDGRSAHLADAKGLHDIVMLLRSPGQDVHVSTLLGVDAPASGADPILDEQATAAYRARLSELDADIAEADRRGDQQRSERASTERAALLHELSSSVGLGGRPRRLGDETERARKTVSARIRDVLARIERAHPELAQHLRDSISTGTVCRYTPSADRRWLT
jgi:tetratricopeptide (TPR) repeat protein